MLEPNVIVMYVNNLTISRSFYQDLFNKSPVESSPSFTMFKLSNGMGLGLKDRRTVQPGIEGNGSKNGELAFTVANKEEVDALFLSWKEKRIRIAQRPTQVSFGYTFLAEDPDGNRLRVAALSNI
ncbi:VOC family protein [Legionella jamestowniensis]|uniref:Bleomycin resistance protein n=1 Tax=Legionella jamestowniensis TaxID=455 RepID=A0A0W0UKS2_9GAMM|nr:VOC family protein [Legionella jamestowniensis]KTD08311.1 bleomycin resistance protein [Legionella jamestowniensis]OCH97162.1 hypothetical protein A8135_05920 [Legionella jamestowniensis]SFL49583.1 Catechol 2,3-dioxygenase [Legionella jamestowniensis DSM 19215]